MSEDDATTVASGRGRAMAARRAATMATVFEGRKYRILREIHLGRNQRFVTPLGNQGRHGFLLEEIGAHPQNVICVGITTLRKAAELYGSVDLPPARSRQSTAGTAPITADQIAAADAEAAALEDELS